jgi:membrane-associated phospholipid phosphatase
LLFGCVAAPCMAADDEDLPLPPLLEDARLYVTAPIRWDRHDWLFAGGTLLTIAASHHSDERVYQHFNKGVSGATADTHGTSDALPAVAVVAGTWALSFVFDDSNGYHETRNMLEAGGFSAMSTLVLKQVVRRERPVNGDSNGWFKGGDSFPSMHVSAAMAIGTVLAESGGEDYRWIRRGLGYGLGTATMYLRLKHQQHWLSDTVAGAALGYSTARFVLNRNKPAGSSASLLLMPMDNGIMLSYAVALH